MSPPIREVGTIYGAIAICSGLGSAFGSWSGGLIPDWTHSYNPLIAFSLVSVVLGMIPFLLVPALRRLPRKIRRSVVWRKFDRVVLLAGAEFEDFPQHSGRHGRNRIDPKYRLAGRADDLVGHADQALIAAAAEEQADDRDLAEHVVEPVHC